MTRERVAGAMAPLAVYVGLVGWLTWPLPAHLRTHLPSPTPYCATDALHMAWVLAYQAHRLVTAPTLLAEANIFHPTPHALFYGETGYGALPYFAPVFWLTGDPALALNLTFLASVALTCWSLHLVVRRWSGSHLGGFVAGWTYLTTPWVLWMWLPVAPNNAVLQQLPWIVLVAAAEPRLSTLVPLLVLQGLTSPYAAAAALVPLGILGAARLLLPASRRGGVTVLVASAIAALVLLGAYAGQIGLRLEDPALVTRTFWPNAQGRLADLPWEPFERGFPMGAQAGIFWLIGAGAVALVLPLGRRANWRAWGHATFWTITGLVISLTPVVTWYDQPVALPHAALARVLPVYDVLREPHRLAMAGLVGLCLLAGLGFARCAQGLAALLPARLATMATVATLALLATVTYGQYRADLSDLPHSYPLRPALAQDSELVRALREGRGAVVELPAPFRTELAGALPQARAMYRSIFHWRPVLNGYDGYYPAGFPARLALAERLPDPEALAVLRAETGLATVLVHAAELTPAARRAWEAAANDPAHGLVLRARDGDALLFEVAPRDVPRTASGTHPFGY